MAARPKTDEGTPFTIEKLQRIAGEADFTTGDLTAELGQSVEYEIVVTNTSDSTIELLRTGRRKLLGHLPRR